MSDDESHVMHTSARRPRRTRGWLRLTVGLAAAAAALATPARPAFAQDGYYLEAAGDYSPVKIAATDQSWRTGRLSGGFFENGRAGWTVALERQQRDRLVDWSAVARGFRRTGDWTFSGGVGYGNDPTFSYRHSYEGEIARTIVGTLVAHGGYRYLEFTGAKVHLIQPAATLYMPHGEVGARYFIARNQTREITTGTLLVQGTVEVHPRLKLGGGGAFGERIFDIAALAASNAEAWVGFGYAQVNAGRHVSINIGVGRAHEDPFFSQETVSLGVRYTFGGRP